MTTETVFKRNNVDEYFVLLLDKDSSATLSAGSEELAVSGYTISIMPPGETSVKVSRGVLIRVISTRNEDVAAKCSNART